MGRHLLFAAAVVAAALLSAAACSSFEDAPADPASDAGGDSSPAIDGASDAGPSGDAVADADASPSSAYRAAVLADQPLAYWRMGKVQSGNVVPDETSRANPLILTGPDFTVDAPGVFADDRAVWFGGGSQGHPTTSAPFLFNGNAVFTLECWARRELDDAGGVGETFQHLVSFVEGYSTAPDGSTENGYILYLRTDSAATHADYGALVGGPTAVQGTLTAAGAWTHYAMVMDGIELVLYVNAAEQGRAVVKGGLSLRAVQLTLANASNDTRFFRGFLDEVAIYGKALSAQTILAHYQIARP